MTEQTMNTETLEATETEAAKTPKVNDVAPIPFPDDLPTDSVATPLLEQLYSLSNDVREMVKTHREFDKGDDAAASIIRDAEAFEGETDDEFILSVRKLAKLKEAVKSLTASIEANAQAQAAEQDGNGFDADKSRQDIRAKRSEASELYKTILTVFELTGKVRVTRSATGAVEDVEPLDEYGEALDAVSKLPNVRGSKGTGSTGGNSETAKVRAWAKEEFAAGRIATEVGDKGRIPQDVQDAYAAAHAA